MNASHNWLCMIFDSKLSFGDFAWLLTYLDCWSLFAGFPYKKEKGTSKKFKMY